MRSCKEFDIVILKEDIAYEGLKKTHKMCDEIPLEGIKKGTRGVIVHIFSSPSEAYIVEFFDAKGKEIEEICLEPHQIELLKSN